MWPADGPDKPPVDIDFTPPWPRISFMSGLQEALQLQSDPQWPSNEALQTEEARQYFLRLVHSPAASLRDCIGCIPMTCDPLRHAGQPPVPHDKNQPIFAILTHILNNSVVHGNVCETAQACFTLTAVGCVKA